MTIKQGIKLSAIIDKMGIKIANPKAGLEEVGADLMIQLVAKAYKAEQEIYSFVSEIKKITPKEAEEIDLAEFIKELSSVSGLGDFFKSAAK